jgi:hypothetical protein
VEGSQAEIDMRLGIVCTVRNGLIVRGREYATREKALEAAGLPVTLFGRVPLRDSQDGEKRED